MPRAGRIGIVIPVQDAEADVGPCLASVVPQAAALDATVVVVDDASSDSTTAIVRSAGASVVELDRPYGPYVARNAGWRALPEDVDVVVFTDVRNRAEPGWLAALVAPLADDRVAVAGGNVRMGGDGRLAHRFARSVDILNVEDRLSSDWLPYVPTASMAVRRRVLEELRGFREVRSAGDVDLCWRAQLVGLGSVVAAPASEMVCEPRGRPREVLRQWARWGRSNAEVRARFAADGCPLGRPASRRSWVAGTIAGLGSMVRHRRRDLALFALDRARVLAYDSAYRRAWREVSGEARAAGSS